MGDLLMFISGTALTWSSPEITKLSDSTSSLLKDDVSSEEYTWVSSLVTLGAAIGPFIYGYLSNKFGRKYVLLSMGVPFLISYITVAYAKTVYLFYFARLLAGLAVGGVFAILPVYVGEITTKINRGTLSATMSCAVCLGFLFSYVFGPYLSVMLFNLILAIFPALFLVLFSVVGVECPHYYLHKQQNDMAKASLQKIRAYVKNEVLEKELLEIQAKISEEGHGSIFDIFRSRGATKAFIVAVGLLIFQQFSGINAVLFYSQTIFKQTGASLEPAVCSIIIGSVQFASSLVTPLIADRFGRKTILLYSATGMILSELPLGVYSYLKDHGTNMETLSFLPIFLLTIFIFSYNSGFGPIPWIVLGEIFPNKIKTIATSLVSCINWFLAFLITKYFDTMINTFGMGQSFWAFAVFCIVATVFTHLYVVETKGKSLEEIQDILND
ncbi:hypothetical protein NQ314_014730 [Rhamnusium bicolor]|uniref:Major facilitator superfamily (MFS) profile domain-containing protein n=1 Tax=Rhamnusium bicolor TaxID=1586634 RepID=A0AAV8X068_9CUCU|nr:hypothetical protein NQ314_014730 [Rhamnusium bicolor]